MKDPTRYLVKNLPKFTGGSLRMFGDWFGRPYDNFHKPTKFEFENDILTITFNEDETLTIWNPRGIKIGPTSIIVAEATHVRWEWFYYGKPKLEENLFFTDYVKSENGIKADSNVNWYSPEFKTLKDEPAVQIV